MGPSESNHVYVIPGEKILSIRDGALNFANHGTTRA